MSSSCTVVNLSGGFGGYRENHDQRICTSMQARDINDRQGQFASAFLLQSKDQEANATNQNQEQRPYAHHHQVIYPPLPPPSNSGQGVYIGQTSEFNPMTSPAYTSDHQATMFFVQECDHHALSHQDQVSRMRERLFRHLSKVPIKVESVSRETHEASPGGRHPNDQPSNSSRKRSFSERLRDPLVIQYYHEKALTNIIELHFACSLTKPSLQQQQQQALVAGKQKTQTLNGSNAALATPNSARSKISAINKSASSKCSGTSSSATARHQVQSTNVSRVTTNNHGRQQTKSSIVSNSQQQKAGNKSADKGKLLSDANRGKATSSWHKTIYCSEKTISLVEKSTLPL